MKPSKRIFSKLIHHALVGVGCVGLTLLCFLVLPLIQTIGDRAEADTTVRQAEVASEPPPPPPPEEEPEEPEEPEEKPELEQQEMKLDLSQISINLNPGAGGAGVLGGNFKVDLNTVTKGGGGGLFSLSELDQRPRAVYQKSPNITGQVRKQAPGKANIIFIVSEKGRVEQAKVQSATHPVLGQAALEAVRQWKFEPGKRQGKPVRFRMKVPIVFPDL